MNLPGGLPLARTYQDTLFPAQLGAYQSGLYDWQELSTDASNASVVMLGGRVGYALSGFPGSPAVELNGRAVASGSIVWLRQRGVPGGVQGYEFDAGEGFLSSGDLFASGVTNNYYSQNVYNNQTVFNSYFSWSYTTFTGVSGTLYYSGFAVPSTPKQRLILYSGTTVAGFTGATSGQLLVLWNAGDGSSPAQGPWTIAHNSADAPNGSRVICPLSGAYTLWPNDGAILEFDGTSGVGGSLGAWRFDHPTIGAGNGIGGGGTSGLRTYAVRNLKAGSGLTYLPDANEGGAGVLMVSPPSSGGTGGGLDYNYPQAASKTGTRWAGADRYYYWGRLAATNTITTAGATSLPNSGNQMAMPLYAPRGGTVDQVAFFVSVASIASGDQHRIGIYDNVSAADPYPNNLLFDTGAVDTKSSVGLSGGLVTAAVPSLVFNPGLYWLTFQMVTHATPTVSLAGINGNQFFPIFGTDATFSAPGIGLYLTNQALTLANPWTSGAAVFSPVGTFGTVPIVAVRYSD